MFNNIYSDNIVLAIYDISYTVTMTTATTPVNTVDTTLPTTPTQTICKYIV